MHERNEVILWVISLLETWEKLMSIEPVAEQMWQTTINSLFVLFYDLYLLQGFLIGESYWLTSNFIMLNGQNESQIIFK